MAGGDGGWHLQGEKTLVSDAAEADLLLVSADDGDGPRLFAVEAGATGLTIESTQLLDSSTLSGRHQRRSTRRSPRTGGSGPTSC